LPFPAAAGDAPVRAEIKVGARLPPSYFLYPIIRALDESFQEP